MINYGCYGCLSQPQQMECVTGKRPWNKMVKNTNGNDMGGWRDRDATVVRLNFAMERPNFAAERPNFAVAQVPPK